MQASILTEYPQLIWSLVTGVFVIFIGIVGYFTKRTVDHVDRNEIRLTEIEHNYLDRFEKVLYGISELSKDIAIINEKVGKQVEICTLIQSQKNIN